MTPQEAHEWIGVAVMAGFALALVLVVLTLVAWFAVWAWDEWRKSRRPAPCQVCHTHAGLEGDPHA